MATTSRTDLSVGQVLILPGIALTLIGPNFDGVLKGMCLGAGVMLILLGVSLIGAHLRAPRGDDQMDDRMWLPSRDDASPETDPGTSKR